jgi:hypothetical protein
MKEHPKRCHCGGKGYVVVHHRRVVKGEVIIAPERERCWGRQRRGRGGRK